MELELNEIRVLRGFYQDLDESGVIVQHIALSDLDKCVGMKLEDFFYTVIRLIKKGIVTVDKESPGVSMTILVLTKLGLEVLKEDMVNMQV